MLRYIQGILKDIKRILRYSQGKLMKTGTWEECLNTQRIYWIQDGPSKESLDIHRRNWKEQTKERRIR